MVHSFLLIGQSNMAGRGFLSEVDMICDTRIKMLRNGIWMPMTEPIHFDYPWAGVGMAPSFATEWLKDNPDEEIGFIPCAMGASCLDQWEVGEPLFDYAVTQAKFAMKNSSLDGILWHQGESDCVQELIPSYESKLQKIIDSFRNELNIKDIPFILGGLPPFLEHSSYLETSKYHKDINQILQTLVKKQECCYYVSADGLESNPDLLHLSARAQRKFGLRYYEAYRIKANVNEPLKNEPDFLPKNKPLQGNDRIAYIGKNLFNMELQL